MPAKTVNIFVNGAPWSFSQRIVIPADGVTYKTIKLVYSPATSENIVRLESTAVGAISVVDGTVDVNSAFEFILGPDVRRGNFDIQIFCDAYPHKTISVSFR